MLVNKCITICIPFIYLVIQSPATDIKRNAYLSDATRLPPLTLLYILAKMPPIRTPLRSIFGNCPKGSEITPYMRGQVVRQAFKGAKTFEITRDLKLDRFTVNYTL